MPNVPGPGPSLRSQWLGDKVRDLRKSRKMSLKEVGDYLQRDQGTISRYENGELPVRRGDLTVMLDLFGVSDSKVREDLEQLREECWRKDWWDQHREDLGKDFINMPWLESRAKRICSYQHMLMEGLLQTRDYAEAVIRNAENPDTSEDQIDRWIDLRLDRQRILTQDEPPQLSVILEESVLRRQIGSDQIWAAQLRHLLEAAEGENVELRVMPFANAPHAGHQGSFILFEMPDPYPEVAYVDTLAGPLFVEQPTVERFSRAWQDLYETALNPDRSTALVSKFLEDME
jgi:transcriptional regulator with XRE-family HTH domain